MENKRRMQKEAEALFRARHKGRRRLAELPFEKKIRILGDLQKTANEILTTVGGIKRRSWEIRK